LEEAKDSIQTTHVGPTYTMTGSVDGYVRTYDLRKGELRSDFIGRTPPPPQNVKRGNKYGVYVKIFYTQGSR